MKLGPVTKLDKRDKTTAKKLIMTSCQKFVTSFSFFPFMTILEESGSQITEAESVKLIKTFIVTFYLTKRGNRTKKSPIQLLHYCSE